MWCRSSFVAGAVVVCGVGVAFGQTGFQPASELVAVEPPPDVVPLNGGQVILGLADRYVYQFGTLVNARIRVTRDFVSITELTLPADGALAEPVGVSEDGLRVVGRVGFFTPGLSRACVWVEEGAPQVLVTGTQQNQRPRSVSLDATRWALTAGIGSSVESYLAGDDVGKPIFPEAGFDQPLAVYASAISPDGLTVAGQYNGSDGPNFTWSEAEGGRLIDPLSGLGLLPVLVSDGATRIVYGSFYLIPGHFSVSHSYGHGRLRSITGMNGVMLSRDGSMLLGATTGPTPRAAVWTETLGTEDLGAALMARGIDLRGWMLKEARYVTADGRTLVGRGTAPGSSATRWWVATVEPFAAADIGKAGGLGGSDGKLDNNDFIVFINRFFARDGRADVGRAGGERGGDGAFDNNDFCAFIGLFFGGEP